MANRVGLTVRLAGAAALLIAGSVAASAQYYGPRPFVFGYAGPVHGFGPVYPGPVYRSGPVYRPGPRFLHPSDIVEILRDQGFRSVDVLHRQGEVFVVNAVSPRTGQTRLIVDAFEGNILERFSAGPQRRVTTTGSVTPRTPTAPPRATTSAAPPPSAKAEAPAPPRRPVAQPTPNQPVSRRPSDWAPINSVPPAALE